MNLEKFFKGLFDFCFPIDFKSQLRRKLDDCYQNNLSVDDYVYQLEELHMMLGIRNNRQRVLNLWKGFHPDIIEALWMQKLNPDISSWKKVVRVAHRLEVSKKGRLDIRTRSGGRVEMQALNQEKNDVPDDDSDTAPSEENSAEYNNESEGSASDVLSCEGSQDNKYARRIDLSDSERENLMRAGRCFCCKEHGHIARHCPQNDDRVTKSEPNDNVSKLLNYRIEIESDNDNDYDDDDDEPYVSYGINLGAIHFDPQEKKIVLAENAEERKEGGLHTTDLEASEKLRENQNCFEVTKGGPVLLSHQDCKQTCVSTVVMHGLTTPEVKDSMARCLLVHLDAKKIFGCLSSMTDSEWHPEDREQTRERMCSHSTQCVGGIEPTKIMTYITPTTIPNTCTPSMSTKAPELEVPTLETPSYHMTPETIPASPSTTHDDNQPPSFPDHENPGSLPRCHCQMGTSHPRSYCRVPNRDLMPDSTSTLCEESIISGFGSSRSVKTIPIIQTHHPSNFPMQSAEKSSIRTQNTRLTTRNKVLKAETTDQEVRKLEVTGRDRRWMTGSDTGRRRKKKKVEGRGTTADRVQLVSKKLSGSEFTSPGRRRTTDTNNADHKNSKRFSATIAGGRV
jgi:hypothetical protein